MRRVPFPKELASKVIAAFARMLFIPQPVWGV